MNRDERWPRWHGIRWHQVGDDDPDARGKRRVTSPTVNIHWQCEEMRMYGTLMLNAPASHSPQCLDRSLAARAINSLL